MSQPACHQADASPLARAAAELWTAGPLHDRDGADPRSLCKPLRRHGLFVAALPVTDGGRGLATDAVAAPELARTLMGIGAGDLSAGRLYEGHVNAVKLVFHYGDAAQRRSLAADVRAGAVCGVWNAESAPGLALAGERDGRLRLSGAKTFCSGVGLVDRPLVTARAEGGGSQMLALTPHPAPPHDLSGWTPRGMRATATGTVDFTGLTVGPETLVGAPGDYTRAPLFKGGAWRFAAVQTGATLRLAGLMRSALRDRGRDGDPHQRVRLGTAALEAETAVLWIMRAASITEDAQADPEAVDAYVGLARLAVERAALAVIALADRGVGLAAFTRPDPIERVVRDLSTYLRQPSPDATLDEAAAYLSARSARSGGMGAPPWSVVAALGL